MCPRLARGRESRDFDALLPYASPDAVYDTSPSGFGVYEGQAAIREFIEVAVGRASPARALDWHGAAARRRGQ